ncbi:T9SS type A sorting domain-containing protein [Polaribacter sejongensis]|uniref:T9SS type A sorting domain-containing protein n=1 Tax=Polaribacter sejongensis TaxID=985043 RepID=UPI0035A6EE99
MQQIVILPYKRGSPAINTGDNTKIPTSITKDLLGNQRIFDTTVDMGVYEFGSSVLGVNDNFNVFKSDVTVYPNPTVSNLNIKMDSNLKRAIVYSVLGNKVLETTSKKITTSNLKSGLYLIKIEDENGTVSTKKFIKK